MTSMVLRSGDIDSNERDWQQNRLCAGVDLFFRNVDICISSKIPGSIISTKPPIKN